MMHVSQRFYECEANYYCRIHKFVSRVKWFCYALAFNVGNACLDGQKIKYYLLVNIRSSHLAGEFDLILLCDLLAWSSK
uniref:Uncharacterized protein n=1 Tax=Rhizophora mucronata TaxID=61149 RepID=A0A2P2QUF9_RHIMU